MNACVLERNEDGHCRLRFSGTRNVFQDLESMGEVPLPPYITRDAPNFSPDDRETLARAAEILDRIARESD